MRKRWRSAVYAQRARCDYFEFGDRLDANKQRGFEVNTSRTAATPDVHADCALEFVRRLPDRGNEPHAARESGRLGVDFAHQRRRLTAQPAD